MYGYDFNNTYQPDFTFSAAGVWIIVSLVLAIVGGLTIYFVFLNKKNEGKYKGFLGWLYDFLNFKNLTLEMILKILYIISAIFITLGSFASIGTNFLNFILILIIGNIVLRITYEFLLMIILLVQNTNEINKKLDKKETAKPKDKISDKE